MGSIGKILIGIAAMLIAIVIAKRHEDQNEASDDVEVGLDGADLRLWVIKEAIRHGELRMGAQAMSLAAMETRASSILGWSVAGSLALGAAAPST